MHDRRIFTECDHVVRLQDGRYLGYAEYGDPDGVPVISNHGGMSSRLDVAPAHEEARRHGFRIISPDRPGIGLSTRQPGRTLTDWSSDVAELADRLGIDRFALLGWSQGGDFALAVAHELGDRVVAASVVGTGIPSDWPEAKQELALVDRALVDLAVRAPRAERAILRVIDEVAMRSPRLFRWGADVPDDVAEPVRQAVIEGVHDTMGALDEYRIVAAPLDFAPEEIAIPVHFWHGALDHYVPLAWAEDLAGRIPDASLTVIPGADHFLWYHHWDRMLDRLRADVTKGERRQQRPDPPAASASRAIIP